MHLTPSARFHSQLYVWLFHAIFKVSLTYPTPASWHIDVKRQVPFGGASVSRSYRLRKLHVSVSGVTRRCWFVFHFVRDPVRAFMSPLQRRLAARASIDVSSSHAFPTLRMSAALLLFTKLKIVPAIIFPALQSLWHNRGTLSTGQRAKIDAVRFMHVCVYLCNLPWLKKINKMHTCSAWSRGSVWHETHFLSFPLGSMYVWLRMSPPFLL